MAIRIAAQTIFAALRGFAQDRQEGTELKEAVERNSVAFEAATKACAVLFRPRHLFRPIKREQLVCALRQNLSSKGAGPAEHVA